VADNTLTGTGVAVATRSVTYSGDASQNAQVIGLVAFSGSDDAKTATDIPGDASNGLDVDVTRLPALPSGTNNIGDVDVLTLPGIAGDIAHDSADSGNPVKMGGRARTSSITAVANDDRVDVILDTTGRQIVIPYALNENSTDGTNSSTGTGDTAVIVAPGAGIRLYITTITVYNSSTTNTYVTVKDGTTAKLVLPAPAQGGCVVTLPRPLRITANTAFNFASNTGVTTMFVSAVGYTSTV
jgi:hypothetical protein